MLSISRLLLVVLCANAYVSTAADAKFPSRFDMQLLNVQSLDAGGSFSYELVTSMGLSVSPVADGLDAYTFSFDGAIASANQLPTMTMGVTDRLSYTLQRDPKSQEVFSNDIDAGVMRQANAYFAALGGAQTRTGRWTERARIFSPAYIDLPGENPNVAFNVRSASHDGSEIKIATYSSEQFSFWTTVGQTVRARFVGYEIAADDWRVPLARGFALIGDIEETDGGRIPLALRKKTLAVHPVTGREYLDPTSYVDAGLARQIDAASVFDAGSKPQQILPNWLSDIHMAALHANALSGAMAEGRSNAAVVAAIGAVILADAVIKLSWNTGVEIGHVIAGRKKLSEANPLDDSGPYKTKGLVGKLGSWLGKAANKLSVAVGLSENTAKQVGEVTDAAVNIATIFVPSPGAAVKATQFVTKTASPAVTVISKAASSAGNVAGNVASGAGKLAASGAGKLASSGVNVAGKLASGGVNVAGKVASGAGKAASKVSDAVVPAVVDLALNHSDKISRGLALGGIKVIKGADKASSVASKVASGASKVASNIASSAGNVAPTVGNSVSKVVLIGSEKSVNLASGASQKVVAGLGKLLHYLRKADVFGVKTADYISTAGDLYKFMSVSKNLSYTLVEKVGQQMPDDLSIEPSLNIKAGYDLGEKAYHLGEKFLNAVIQPEINSITDASKDFRNATFTPPPTLAPSTGDFIDVPESTGGFVDAQITLPLEFSLRDLRPSIQFDDAALIDFVRLNVRDLNGVKLNTEVGLYGTRRFFSPTVAPGPVEIKITAISDNNIYVYTGEVEEPIDPSKPWGFGSVNLEHYDNTRVRLRTISSPVPLNTGFSVGLDIDSTVTEGPSNQTLNLNNMGESGVLKIVADPPQ